MNTQEKIVIMQAWVNGKKIEWKSLIVDNWLAMPLNQEEPSWGWGERQYRIAPQVSFRPYNADEIPLGAEVVSKGGYVRGVITRVERDSQERVLIYIGDKNPRSPAQILATYTFMRGEPCGVKE